MCAYNSFDDGTATDKSGNGRDGVWVGTEAYGDSFADHVWIKAAQFDGNSRINVAAFRCHLVRYFSVSEVHLFFVN